MEDTTGQTAVRCPPDAGGGALLERSAELEAISHALGSCRSGVGQMVVVAGPAGIGKTSLLSASRHSAGDGFNVLSAQADPVTAEAAFGCIRELLTPMIGGGAASMSRRVRLPMAGAFSS